MNNEWAAQELREFASLTTVTTSPEGYIVRTVPEWQVQRDLQVIEQILDRVLPNWRSLPDPPGHDGFRKHHAAAQRAIGLLEREHELRENLGEAAPQLDAQRLHSWVWEPARLLWRNGHLREAVGAAARQVNAEAQTKLGRRDVSESRLFQEAFSVDPPASGRPRLRLMDDDGTDAFRNRHVGAMTFAQGCYMAVRNPLAHEVADEPTEHEALEQLSAFSLLARWVDRATVARAPA